MAVPQRRISKTAKRKRRTHQKLVAPNLISCSNCGEKIKSHIVCPSCGYYDGKKAYFPRRSFSARGNYHGKSFDTKKQQGKGNTFFHIGGTVQGTGMPAC